MKLACLPGFCRRGLFREGGCTGALVEYDWRFCREVSTQTVRLDMQEKSV